ncbi:hypothetical protein [Micromonospora sp. DT227]|uniref:hypothetical protein n=1 Tax=Micromonospora sp. DT227 TaxID=3393433 RepID=UPI003CF8A1BB
MSYVGTRQHTQTAIHDLQKHGDSHPRNRHVGPTSDTPAGGRRDAMDTDTEPVETIPGGTAETPSLPDPASWTPEPDDMPEAPDLSMWIPTGSDPELDIDQPREGISALVAGAGLLTAVIAGLGVFNIWGGVGLALAGGTAGAGAILGPVALADYKRRLKNGPRKSQNRNGWPLRRPARTSPSGRSGGRTGGMFAGRRGRAAARRAAAASAATGRRATGGRSTAGRSTSATPKAGRLRSAGRKPTNAAGSVGSVGRSTRGSASRSTVGRPAGARPTTLAGRALDRLRRRQEPMRAARQQHRVNQLRNRLREGGDRADARRARRRDRWVRVRRGVGRGLVAATVRPARWFGRQLRRPLVAAWRRIRSSRLARILRVVGVGTLLTMALSSLARSIGDVLRRIPGWMWAPETEEQRAAKAAVLEAQRQEAAARAKPPLVTKPDHVGEPPAVQRPGRPAPSTAPTFLSPARRFDAPAVPTPRPVKGPAMADDVALHPIWETIVDTFRDQLGNWEMPGPGEGVPDTDHLLQTMGPAFRQIGEVVGGFGQKLDSDTFAEAEVSDYVADVALGLTEVGEEGDDVYATWREVQEADIRRHEDPRPAEESANV